MKTISGLLLLVAFSMPVMGFAQNQGATPRRALKVTSSAFPEGGKIPKKYTCDDTNVSPPLRIEGAPSNTKSVALIVEDPDAPGQTWIHWLVWNIDPHTTEIREKSVPPNAVQGASDFGSATYGGPCPPSGTHRYYFKAYALDTMLSLSPGTKKGALEKAMAGHIVAEGSLMGNYSRGR